MCVPGLSCYSCPHWCHRRCLIELFKPWFVLQNSNLPTTSPDFHPVRCYVRAVLSVDFSVRWMVPGSAACKIPGKKLSTAKLKPLQYLKYVILVFVILLPAFVTNSLGMERSFLLQIHLPTRRTEGAIPLSLANSGIRAALGRLFTFKF